MTDVIIYVVTVRIMIEMGVMNLKVRLLVNIQRANGIAAVWARAT